MKSFFIMFFCFILYPGKAYQVKISSLARNNLKLSAGGILRVSDVEADREAFLIKYRKGYRNPLKHYLYLDKKDFLLKIPAEYSVCFPGGVFSQDEKRAIVFAQKEVNGYYKHNNYFQPQLHFDLLSWQIDNLKSNRFQEPETIKVAKIEIPAYNTDHSENETLSVFYKHSMLNTNCSLIGYRLLWGKEKQRRLSDQNYFIIYDNQNLNIDLPKNSALISAFQPTTQPIFLIGNLTFQQKLRLDDSNESYLQKTLAFFWQLKKINGVSKLEYTRLPIKNPWIKKLKEFNKHQKKFNVSSIAHNCSPNAKWISGMIQYSEDNLIKTLPCYWINKQLIILNTPEEVKKLLNISFDNGPPLTISSSAVLSEGKGFIYTFNGIKNGKKITMLYLWCNQKWEKLLETDYISNHWLIPLGELHHKVALAQHNLKPENQKINSLSYTNDIFATKYLIESKGTGYSLKNFKNWFNACTQNKFKSQTQIIPKFYRCSKNNPHKELWVFEANRPFRIYDNGTLLDHWPMTESYQLAVDYNKIK